jgi:hypothetical protein
MRGWGRSARRLAGAVALALALTAGAVLAGWGQPGAPVTGKAPAEQRMVVRASGLRLLDTRELDGPPARPGGHRRPLGGGAAAGLRCGLGPGGASGSAGSA